jgi:adenylosuccinate lyase
MDRTARGILLSGALSQACRVLEGLEVDKHRMRANLDLTHGLVVSEAVTMGLARLTLAANMPMISSTTSVVTPSNRSEAGQRS